MSEYFNSEELRSEIDELFRVSDLAIFALYRKFLELESDEQTSEED